jgi:hypothetical protein
MGVEHGPRYDKGATGAPDQFDVGDPMNSGVIGQYRWIESLPPDGVTLREVLCGLRQYLINYRAVNVSWDSGLLIPSEVESSDGWTFQQGRTVSPRINERLIEAWPSCDGGFEEWYFFSTLPEHLQLSSYCNWGGTSIADWQQLVPVPTGVDLQKQLDESRPYAVVGVGQRICAISKDPLLIQTFRRTVATLQGSAEG